MKDEPLQDTDVTKYYGDFDKALVVPPTKQEVRESRLATSSHLSKERASKASSMSRQTGRSAERESSQPSSVPGSPGVERKSSLR